MVKLNECMEFPGVGTEYISVKKVNYTEGIPELTIAVWIKTPQRGMNSVNGIEVSTFVSPLEMQYSVIQHSSHLTSAVQLADWHGKVKVTDDKLAPCCLLSFDAEMRRIYVDGKLDVEAPTETNNKMIGPKGKRFGFIGVGSEADVFNGNCRTYWMGI